MKIYVIETVFDYTTQCGFSSSKKIAEKIAKEMSNKYGRKYWVHEYTENKNLYTEFDND